MTDEKKFRVESDLLGELNVPADALYGVQTQRGINNYHISRKTMRDYPDFIIANAYVKLYSLLEQYYLKIGEKKAAAEYTQAIENVMRQQYGRQ